MLLPYLNFTPYSFRTVSLSGGADHQPVRGQGESIMHIGVIGATGTIGSRVVSEALSRGHRITAFSRDASQIEDSRENVTWKSVDILDAADIAAVLPGLDVLISGFGPGNPAKDTADSVAPSIPDPPAYAPPPPPPLT